MRTFKTKKYLGQNFLFDPSILRKIINVAQINKDDIVVEIGAGYGNLTLLLANSCNRVIAIEYDKELFYSLNQKTKNIPTIETVHCDALEYNYELLEKFKVVANIPYYITKPILLRLIKAKEHIESITLTIQKEVAQRIVAKPNSKDYGFLTLVIQYYTEPKIAFLIPAGAFRPKPKVDSAVIHMKFLPEPRVKVSDERLFFRVIKESFNKRRKTISNALSNLSSEIVEILTTCNIDPKRRAETLSIEEFQKITEAIHLLKKEP
ncbi:MAG: 16S rRNA (adenine(1518)-N(6)/adenine(1519)-N(6))-dimethyltransferase RsmA [Thermodesulfovibrionales bacterium]|nr:16S rRNA (adenine(1518)-N(6)/adenine(1519)-N(6))-dimethyltransferase RsmA [Thermodesulfovibrionales bacterium]